MESKNIRLTLVRNGILWYDVFRHYHVSGKSPERQVFSMNAQSFTARIGGREYTLSAQGDPERLKRIAEYLDRKIGETSMHTALNGEISAVIAGLSVTEELFDAKDEAQRLRTQLYEISRGASAAGASHDA